MEFVDELPTRRRGRPSLWPARLAPLRERPGEWADLGAWSNCYAAQLRKRFPEFEWTQRTLPGKGTHIYARFVGSD